MRSTALSPPFQAKLESGDSIRENTSPTHCACRRLGQILWSTRTNFQIRWNNYGSFNSSNFIQERQILQAFSLFFLFVQSMTLSLLPPRIRWENCEWPERQSGRISSSPQRGRDPRPAESVKLPLFYGRSNGTSQRYLAIKLSLSYRSIASFCLRDAESR